MGWLRRRWPECLLLALGCALRFASLSWASVYDGYDFASHFTVIRWFGEHWELPSVYLSREAFQPPLYYVLMGLLLRARLEPWHLGVPSLILGCARLGLIQLGLVRVLPERRVARLAALALAAVLPASVHMDGMASNEVLNAFLGTLALVLVTYVFEDRARVRNAALLGLVLGLGALTKISTVALVGAVAVGAALEFAAARGRRLRVAKVWSVAFAVLIATSGWYYARNHHLYGKAFLTSFDHKERAMAESVDGVPYWKRRSPGFFVGWSADLYREPYYPIGLQPNPRFFPVLIATTFVDYYNYYFMAPTGDGDELIEATRPVSRAAFTFSRMSFAGGTLIAAATVAAWLAAAVACARRRRFAELVLLLAPLFALLGALHFATQFPFDNLGHIKGTFLQFAAAPLCGLFGVAFAWMWERRRLRPVAVAELCALAFVASYSIYCRFF
ncbi:MAG TPA: glycosyltransferase family 39 protein [Polyangia bacterium]|nr:glycosyltransferase family 39 protein [Polyangia bacterium]